MTRGLRRQAHNEQRPREGQRWVKRERKPSGAEKQAKKTSEKLQQTTKRCEELERKLSSASKDLAALRQLRLEDSKIIATLQTELTELKGQLKSTARTSRRDSHALDQELVREKRRTEELAERTDQLQHELKDSAETSMDTIAYTQSLHEQALQLRSELEGEGKRRKKLETTLQTARAELSCLAFKVKALEARDLASQLEVQTLSAKLADEQKNAAQRLQQKDLEMQEHAAAAAQRLQQKDIEMQEHAAAHSVEKGSF